MSRCCLCIGLLIFLVSTGFISSFAPSFPRCPMVLSDGSVRNARQRRCGACYSSGNDNNNDGKDFWLQQQALVEDMRTVMDDSLAREARARYGAQLAALLAYTAYTGFFISCALWTVFENPSVALSFALGSTLGLAYTYGLGKYVETIGGVATEADAVRGAGVGQARFAFLIILFILVGKFRSSGLMEVPTILGFFTYQIGSLLQGLRANDDE